MCFAPSTELFYAHEVPEMRDRMPDLEPDGGRLLLPGLPEVVPPCELWFGLADRLPRDVSVKILHISDTHGLLPEPIGDWDVVVHSGDMMPNRSYGVRPVEVPFQRLWIEDNAPRFHARYWTKPFLYCPGNHDYHDPTPHMRALGIDARLICNNEALVDGVRFWGFPWVPQFYDWNWMCGPAERREHLKPAVELMESAELDVLVAHGPMYGVLDRNADGERCGSRVLRETLQTVKRAPRALLHGHIHESHGLQAWSRGMLVSNAATTQRIVEIFS